MAPSSAKTASIPSKPPSTSKQCGSSQIVATDNVTMKRVLHCDDKELSNLKAEVRRKMTMIKVNGQPIIRQLPADFDANGKIRAKMWEAILNTGIQFGNLLAGQRYKPGMKPKDFEKQVDLVKKKIERDLVNEARRTLKRKGELGADAGGRPGRGGKNVRKSIARSDGDASMADATDMVTDSHGNEHSDENKGEEEDEEEDGDHKRFSVPRSDRQLRKRKVSSSIEAEYLDGDYEPVHAKEASNEQLTPTNAGGRMRKRMAGLVFEAGTSSDGKDHISDGENITPIPRKPSVRVGAGLVEVGMSNGWVPSTRNRQIFEAGSEFSGKGPIDVQSPGTRLGRYESNGRTSRWLSQDGNKEENVMQSVEAVPCSTGIETLRPPSAQNVDSVGSHTTRTKQSNKLERRAKRARPNPTSALELEFPGTNTVSTVNLSSNLFSKTPATTVQSDGENESDDESGKGQGPASRPRLIRRTVMGKPFGATSFIEDGGLAQPPALKALLSDSMISQSKALVTSPHRAPAITIPLANDHPAKSSSEDHSRRSSTDKYAYNGERDGQGMLTPDTPRSMIVTEPYSPFQQQADDQTATFTATGIDQSSVSAVKVAETTDTARDVPVPTMNGEAVAETNTDITIATQATRDVETNDPPSLKTAEQDNDTSASTHTPLTLLRQSNKDIVQSTELREPPLTAMLSSQPEDTTSRVPANRSTVFISDIDKCWLHDEIARKTAVERHRREHAEAEAARFKTDDERLKARKKKLRDDNETLKAENEILRVDDQRSRTEGNRLKVENEKFYQQTKTAEKAKREAEDKSDWQAIEHRELKDRLQEAVAEKEGLRAVARRTEAECAKVKAQCQRAEDSRAYLLNDMKEEAARKRETYAARFKERLTNGHYDRLRESRKREAQEKKEREGLRG
ncbi:hypothetical protein LTR78_008630 [Recurvomyces mirabilis]|uniref:Uncharacterized protein n=1 Tax=Recurvomyces mirabilis TaxID=574656 RepID=A0AAE0TR26_9PEZI|nr:hypothetical protein LTR78_008630 [Recurvomyces mirabilis]KAK5153459.1 hypothetical protein LTS14_007629 [Recurvomyces mirabilis]